MESGVLYPEIAFHMSAKSVTLLDILKEQKLSFFLNLTFSEKTYKAKLK